MKPIIKKLMAASESFAGTPILEQEKTGWLRSTPERTQHTPGPWFATTASNLVPRVIQKGKPGFVAQMGFPNEGKREANACLISAAPELLEACKAWLHARANGGISHADLYEAAWRKTVAAIAKAEGRDQC